MRSLTCLAAVCLLSSLVGPAFAAYPKGASPFVIFESHDAPGPLDASKLQQCLELTVRELGLENRDLPRIVVYHISDETGHLLGIETNSNYRNNGGGHMRYEMWIVGKASNSLVTYMLENILERHFQLQLDEAAPSKAVIHIERGLDATVDVRSFR